MSENETKLPIFEDEIEIESLRNQLEVRTISISKKYFILISCGTSTSDFLYMTHVI
jgi:hypothetical protein